MSNPIAMLSVPLHRTRIDPTDKVLGVSEGMIGNRPADVVLTVRGLYLTVDGVTVGINLLELARIAGDVIERNMAGAA